MDSFKPSHIWASMSLMNKIITGALLLMAVISIGVVVERIIALSRAQKESGRFAGDANPLIDAWDFARLRALAEKYKVSPLARLVEATVKTFMKHVDSEGGVSPVELARREVARQNEAIGVSLRRGMSALASIGSVAPFVGLLGTVIGIIAAFQGIAASGSGGLGSVSAGIAEALVETALGLMVAIPSVLFFNYLNGRVNHVESALGRSAAELLDQMENEYGRRSDAFRRQKAA
jgi:biopolymer transport protein ExbB